MLVEILMVLGFVSSFQPGDSCIDALHEMRVMERVRIVSTEVLEDNVIAYTLTDGPRISNKTAILVCRRDVEEEEDPETEALEEMAVEDVEMLDDAGDDSAEDAGEPAAE